MGIDVTVIVVNYNTRELLRDCLASVFAETRDVRIEVIIVDNASVDGSCEMVAENFPHVTLIANPDNRGFAAANNQAIHAASGRYCLLLNSDTIVQDHAIDRCVAYMDHHPDVGVLGPRVFWPSGEFQSTVFRFPTLRGILLGTLGLQESFQRLRLTDAGRYAKHDWEVERDVDVVAGCFMLVRRQVVDTAGCLDEDFFMYGEEAEWCHRIWRQGWRITFFPGARIIHIWGGSSKGRKESAAGQLAKRRAQLLVLQKTRGRLVAWAANVLMLIGLPPRLLLWSVSGLFAVVRGRLPAIPFRSRLNLLGFHLYGLFRPVWCKSTVPGPEAAAVSPNPQARIGA